MKITDAIIIFFIITLPVFLFTQMKSEHEIKFAQVNQQHEKSITTAAHDAVNVLSRNVVPALEVGYDSYKITPTDPQLVYDTFIQSLSLNFGAETDLSRSILEQYVPVFAVLDFDGLYLNVYQKVTGPNGDKEFKRVWLPKIPFSYTDSLGNVVNFTVDNNFIELYEATRNEWHTGTREEFAADGDLNVPILADVELFEQERRQLIVKTVQDNIAYYINEHNVYAKEMGITYKFAMPLIDQDDWYNTVDDVGLFAFFQGFTYEANDQVYDEFAFVGARLQKNERIMAGVVDGERLYWHESCEFPYQATEIFNSKKQAAEKGYKEQSCLNPQL